MYGSSAMLSRVPARRFKLKLIRRISGVDSSGINNRICALWLLKIGVVGGVWVKGVRSVGLSLCRPTSYPEIT